MKHTKLVTSLMLSASILGVATPIMADQVKNPDKSVETAMKEKQVNAGSEATKVAQTGNDDAKKTDSKTTDSTKTPAVDANKDGNKDNKPEAIQTLTKQKMIIKKVIAKQGTMPATVKESGNTIPGKNGETAKTTDDSDKGEIGIKKDDIKGVPNSKFTVYDVTDLMNNIIKEKLDVNDKQADTAVKGADDLSQKEVAQKGSASDTTKDSQSTAKVDDKSSSNATSTSESKSESSSSTASTKAESSQTSSESASDKSSSAKDSSSVTSNSDKDSSASKASDGKDTEKQKAADELVGRVQEMRKDDVIRKEIETRAAKMNSSQLHAIANVTTNDKGEADTDLPIDGKYHAYYVVNTETDKNSWATNSAPIVVITPVTDSQGFYAPEFTIYPKSDTIPKPVPAKPGQPTPAAPTPATPTSPASPATPAGTPKQSMAKMYQTGKVGLLKQVSNWLNNFFN